MEERENNNIMNLANQLTFLRMMLIPIFIAALHYRFRLIALEVFTIAAITDAVDGFIARKRKQRTKLGRVLDPVADKCLITASFALLAIMGKLPIWLTILVIGRDIVIVVGSLVLFIISGTLTILPSLLGKITTFFQMSAVLFTLLEFPLRPLKSWWYVVAALFTIASGLDYTIKGIKRASEEGLLEKG